MKRVAPERIEGQIGQADYLLAGTAAVLAAYSAGMSVSSPLIGYFFSAGIALGTLCSLFLRRTFEGNGIDGWLYAILACASVAFGRELNAILPDGGFALSLIVVASLGWMMLLGSFVSWSDSTLLFQMVPAMALFGLVGCFDTYAPSTVLYFIFLLCAATLFARAHRRKMLAKAAESGFAGLDVEHGPRFSLSRATQRLREGPWRWMAGPEWAFGSAAVIVLFSLLGAPILQLSLSNVGDRISISVPQSGSPQPSVTETGFQATETMRIGQGPTWLSDRPVMRAQLAQPEYLRTETYDLYTGRGWTRQRQPDMQGVTWRGTQGTRSYMNRGFAHRALVGESEIPFRLELLQRMESVPIPGELVWVDPGRTQVRPRSDGTVAFPDGIRPPLLVEGVAVTGMKNAATRVPSALPFALRSALDEGGLDPRVRALARDVTVGLASDMQRARRIQEEIERRIRYNLSARATPPNVDPVYHALFESKEGYCDLFASAMVMMARSVGIPARFVVGFYPNPNNRQGDVYLIQEADYHAWAELFFEDAGWVIFDPTEGADSVAGMGRGSVIDRRPLHEREWFRTALVAAGGLLLVTALVLGYRVYWPRWMAPPPARAEAARLYARFARALQRETGRARYLSQTPLEYVESLRERLGDRYAAAFLLTDKLRRAMYGPEEPDRETLRELQSEIVAFGGRLPLPRFRSAP